MKIYIPAESDRISGKSTKHARMTECFCLKDYMASSHSEMERSGIEL